MKRRHPRRFGGERGAVAVEFALLLPLLLTMCFGVFELSELIRADMKLQAAAATVAMLVAEQESVNTSSVSNYCIAGQLVMAPLAAGGLKVTVASVTNTAGTKAVDWQDTTCGGTAIGNPAGLAGTMVANSGDSAIVVQATYAYTSPIAYALTANFALTQDAFQRPRSNVTVVHH